MPDIGIQRLGPGHAQHDGAEHEERQAFVLNAQRIAYVGETASARADAGDLISPATPMTRNHTTMIGPNTRPTLPVPLYWAANRATITRRISAARKLDPGAKTPALPPPTARKSRA